MTTPPSLLVYYSSKKDKKDSTHSSSLNTLILKNLASENGFGILQTHLGSRVEHTLNPYQQNVIMRSSIDLSGKKSSIIHFL